MAAGQGAAAFAGHPNVWVVTVDEGKDADPEGHFRTWLAGHTRDLLFLQVANRSVNLHTVDSAERRASVGRVAPDHASGARLSVDWDLIGFDLPLDRVARGDALRAGFYLRARGPVADVPVLEMDLVDDRGVRYRAARRPLVGDWFAPFKADQVVLGHLKTRIVDGVPGGRYRLRARLAGAAGGEIADLGRVTVLSDPGLPPQPVPRVAIDHLTAEGLRLAGHGGLEAPRRGHPVTVELHWEAQEATPLDLQSYLRLIGLDRGPSPGDPVWAARYQPAPGGRPTTTWVPGLRVVDPITLDLPPDLPPGRYQLEAGLFDPGTKRDQADPIPLWIGDLVDAR
ncbi:MAG TPA: hypothetical protein VHL09_13105 [Dehalococcoidia bacterium]|nr:hypothetical protein [Dehalococcoidia bacterium]